MTVKELIEELQKVSPDLEIYRWNNDNYIGYISEVFRLDWMDMDTHPVVEGVITTKTVKVPVVN